MTEPPKSGGSGGGSAMYFCIMISVPIRKGQGSSKAAFRKHLQKVLPSSVVVSVEIQSDADKKKHRAKVTVMVNKKKANAYCRFLREAPFMEQPIHAQCEPLAVLPVREEEDEEEQDTIPRNDDDDDAAEEKGAASWMNAGRIAENFFQWLHGPSTRPILEELGVDLKSTDRDKVSRLFAKFASAANKPNDRRTRGLVMAALRRQKVFRSQRYSDGLVVCVFALEDGVFPPLPERTTAREKLRAKRKELTANKGGVVVPETPTISPKLGGSVPIQSD